MNRPLFLVSVILAVPVMMIFHGCHRNETPDPGSGHPSGIIDVPWTLVALNDEELEIEREERRPYFSLHAEQNRMDGFTGCNRMFGDFEIDGTQISFGPIGATRMACMETGDLEQDFLKAMEAARSFFLENAELELYDARGRCVALFSAGNLPAEAHGETE